MSQQGCQHEWVDHGFGPKTWCKKCDVEGSMKAGVVTVFEAKTEWKSETTDLINKAYEGILEGLSQIYSPSYYVDLNGVKRLYPTPPPPSKGPQETAYEEAIKAQRQAIADAAVRAFNEQLGGFAKLTAPTSSPGLQGLGSWVPDSPEQRAAEAEATEQLNAVTSGYALMQRADTKQSIMKKLISEGLISQDIALQLLNYVGDVDAD